MEVMKASSVLNANTNKVIQERYSLKDENGKPTETWEDICERVTEFVSKAEIIKSKQDWFKQAMKPLMLDRLFIPNTPCLVNAGKENAQLAACFVLDVPDSMDGILSTVKDAGMIHKTGGGTGMSFEKLRPKGSRVLTTNGVASGPVSFINIFNEVTEAIKQGGVRRGANMGVQNIHHPDILEFIHAKNDGTRLTNFNISVAVTDLFMTALENDTFYPLMFEGQLWDGPIIDPLTGEDIGVAGHLMASEVWRRIIESAHRNGEPGVIFIDTVNGSNLLMNSMGPILSSNPCAEQFLHSNNSCNLGSIDVSKFYDHETQLVNYHWLRAVVEMSVRFLDNVIDVCKWPTEAIERTVYRTRPIGLGIMGFADLCLKAGIKYGSEESLKLADQLMKRFRIFAWQASMSLGAEKGPFPDLAWNEGPYSDFITSIVGGLYGDLYLRNYQVTTIAPTGTISLVAETSSGIEPNFNWGYYRRDSIGERYYVHPIAAQYLNLTPNWDDEESIKQCARTVMENTHRLPDYFVTAHDLTAQEHVYMLAAFQRHVDNSISKTCNGQQDDTIDSVDELYRQAYSLGVKAMSYYRDGSRSDQVISSLVPDSAEPQTLIEKAFLPGEKVYTVDPIMGEAFDFDNDPTVQAYVERMSHKVVTQAVQAVQEYKDSQARKAADVARQEAITPAYVPMPIRIERERVLNGRSWRVMVDNQSMYITVNHDSQGQIVEVFATGLVSPSVGLLVSKMLRGGFSPGEVVRILRKATGTNTIWFNERCCTSPEQVIAECITLAYRELVPVNGLTANLAPGELVELQLNKGETLAQAAEQYTSTLASRPCPECGDILQFKEGCESCYCGYSKCK